MILGSKEGPDDMSHTRTGPDAMSHTIMTTSACFTFELSPLLMFEFDFLSLFCNMNTLRNILMNLGTNVEQDEMTCCVQE